VQTYQQQPVPPDVCLAVGHASHWLDFTEHNMYVDLLIIIFHVIVLLFFILVHGVSVVGVIVQELQRCVKNITNARPRFMWGMLYKCFKRLQAVLSELIIALGSIVAEFNDQWNDSWQVLAKAVPNRPTAQTDKYLRISQYSKHSGSTRTEQLQSVVSLHINPGLSMLQRMAELQSHRTSCCCCFSYLTAPMVCT